MVRKKNIIYNENDIEKLIQGEADKQKKKKNTVNDTLVVDVYDIAPKPEDEKNNSKNILEIITVQCTPFKTLIETLNGILSNINIIFTKEGIKIRTSNKPINSIFVNLEMHAANFEHYHCKSSEEYVIGIKLDSFYKLIRTIGAQNILTLFVDEIDPNRLGISIENKDFNTITTYRINLLELNVENYTPLSPDVYTTIIKMPSGRFQKLCRDANGLTDKVEITRSLSSNDCKQIIFSFDSESVQQETVIRESKDYMIFVKNDKPEEIIQGIYSLKDLVAFTKCTTISKTVKIYLNNDQPLMIEYNIGNLGTIQLSIPSYKLLKPIQEDE